MSKRAKIILWSIAGIIVSAIIIGIWYGKKIFKKITFQNFRITGVNFHGLTLQDIPKILQSGTSKNITVTLGLDIKNENNISIPFCYLKIKLLYNGQEIARTSDTLAKTCYEIPANGILPVSDTVNITLNQVGAAMAIEKLTGKKVKLDYEVELSAVHIPSMIIPTIRGNFEW